MFVLQKYIIFYYLSILTIKELKKLKNNESIWLENNKNIREYRTLNQNIQADVCVIGGGIAGLSTAYYLSKEGMNVAVIEKDRICSKTSGRTTAKITSQHHLFYKYLIDSKRKRFCKKIFESK